jgi:hypothetical protein
MQDYKYSFVLGSMNRRVGVDITTKRKSGWISDFFFYPITKIKTAPGKMLFL